MSLRFILFELAGMFDDPSDTEVSEEGLLWMLESLSQWNELYLKRHPETPHLYDLVAKGQVSYKLPEQIGGEGRFVFRNGEHFRDIPAIIENGGGDCDNLAAWRVAELRRAGYRGVRPFITHRDGPNGNKIYHALVYWPTPKPKGSTEDPSLIAGMGGEERVADREEELRKNRERIETRVGEIAKAVHVGAVSPAAVRLALAKKMGR